MVGPVNKIDYLSDSGTHYAVSIPAWQVVLAGGAAPTGALNPPPKGFRARYRMIQNTATGREKKVKVHAVTSTFWTEAMNTSHTAVDDGTTAGIATAISAGRIGERQLNRS